MPSRSSEFPWATPKTFSSTCLNKLVAVFTCDNICTRKTELCENLVNWNLDEGGMVSRLVPLWPSSEKNGSLKTCYKICINQVRNKFSHHYVLCALLYWDSHIHKNFPISINNHVIHSLRPAARCKHLWLFWLLLQWMSPAAASNDSFQKRCGMHSQCPNWPKHPGQTKCEEQLAWAQGWEESVRLDLVSCRCPLPFQAKRVTVGLAVAKWRNPMLNLEATQEGWNSSIVRSPSDQNEYQSQLATFLEINR